MTELQIHNKATYFWGCACLLFINQIYDDV